MKIIKLLAIVIGIILVIIVSSIFGIPAGSKKGKIKTVGQSQDGRKIVTEEVYRYRIHPLSPEGFFRKGTWDYTFFYEQQDDKNIKLEFLTDDNSDDELLKPILPIYNSDKWAAFRLSEVEYDKVDLFMHIFDSKRLHHTFEIKNVIRVSTCAEEWDHIDSYSIAQSKSDGTITINTLDGLVTYDQSSNKLTINSRSITSR